MLKASQRGFHANRFFKYLNGKSRRAVCPNWIPRRFHLYRPKAPFDHKRQNAGGIKTPLLSYLTPNCGLKNEEPSNEAQHTDFLRIERLKKNLIERRASEGPFGSCAALEVPKWWRTNRRVQLNGRKQLTSYYSRVTSMRETNLNGERKALSLTLLFGLRWYDHTGCVNQGQYAITWSGSCSPMKRTQARIA